MFSLFPLFIFIVSSFGNLNNAESYNSTDLDDQTEWNSSNEFVSDPNSAETIEFAEWPSASEFANKSSIKWNITACTILYNSLSLTFQWIEFHRLQGVDHFILYDDDSDDNILLLSKFYEDQGLPDLVRVLPIRTLRFNHGGNVHDISDYLERQLFILQHCLMTHRFSTRWILNIDVDEFVHVNTTIVPSLVDYLLSYAADKDSLYLQAMRYGTSGSDVESSLDIVQNPKSGRMELVYDNYTLIWDRCRNRAPHPNIDSDYAKRFNETCSEEDLHDGKCIHANGKVVYQPRGCMVPLVHECGQRRPGVDQETWVNMREIRLDHFPFRSRDYIDKFIADYDKGKLDTFEKYDKVWFSSLYDDGLVQFIQPVSASIAKYPSFVPSTDNVV